MNCPKCDADISDTFERDDPSCGISAGWYCGDCDLAIAEWEAPREPMARHAGYAEWKRICRSYGYD